MVAMWAIALGIVVVQRDLGAALLFFAVFLLLTYVATGRLGYVGLGIVLFLVGGVRHVPARCPHVRTRVDIWLDPFATPLTTGYQIIQALYAFGRGGLLGTGLGAGLPTIGGGSARRHPRDPHRLPVRRARRGAGPDRRPGDPRAVPRRHRARPAHRGVGGRRLPVAARRRAGARRRRPGVHHRGRQPQADPADRDHAAVHQLRRLVAARQRHRRRAAARAVRPGRRAAAATEAAGSRSAGSPGG